MLPTGSAGARGSRSGEQCSPVHAINIGHWAHLVKHRVPVRESLQIFPLSEPEIPCYHWVGNARYSFYSGEYWHKHAPTGGFCKSRVLAYRLQKIMSKYKGYSSYNQHNILGYHTERTEKPS